MPGDCDATGPQGIKGEVHVSRIIQLRALLANSRVVVAINSPVLYAVVVVTLFVPLPAFLH